MPSHNYKTGIVFPILCIIAILLFSFFLIAGERFPLKALLSLSLNPCEMDIAINGTISGTIIRQNDSISPYFLKPPTYSDIIGFRVVLKTDKGVTLAEKLEYMISRRTTVFNDAEIKKTPASITSINPRRLETQPKTVFISALEDIPPYTLPAALTAGAYTMVFQVLGKKGVNGASLIFSTTEKPFYYLGERQFTVNDIRMYLPDSTASHTPDAGLALLLEIPLTADKELDPYIVWFDGNKKLDEGKVSEGFCHLLWKTPDSEGFKNIRAEVFPFPPLQKTSGIIKEISIPITVKEKNKGYFAAKSGQFSHWYLFQGNLQDEKGKSGAIISRQSEQWLPTGNGYGLGVGNDSYLIPPLRFSSSKTEKNWGQLLFRLRLVGEGTIAKIVCQGEDGFDRAVLSLVLEKENLRLLLKTGNDETLLKTQAVKNFQTTITISLNFILDQNRLSADMFLKDTMEVNAPFFTVPRPLDGAVYFYLGTGTGDTVAVLSELGLTFNRLLADQASP